MAEVFRDANDLQLLYVYANSKTVDVDGRGGVLALPRLQTERLLGPFYPLFRVATSITDLATRKTSGTM